MRYRVKIKKFVLALLLTAVTVTAAMALFKIDVCAKALDEITDYEIDATVNDDATVTLKYHIEWKVLDSTSEGPLTWVFPFCPVKAQRVFEFLIINLSI